MVKFYHLLAHLSRRLIGELIVYRGILRLSSTFSNDFSEAVKCILFIFIASIGGGTNNCVFIPV